jgi:hypothetical protein
MHHDNWGNCYEDPAYLEDIVHKSKENRPKMKTVVLLAGTR